MHQPVRQREVDGAGDAPPPLRGAEQHAARIGVEGLVQEPPAPTSEFRGGERRGKAPGHGGPSEHEVGGVLGRLQDLRSPLAQGLPQLVEALRPGEREVQCRIVQSRPSRLLDTTPGGIPQWRGVESRPALLGGVIACMGVLLLGFGPGGPLRIWQGVAARRLSTTASSTAASSAGRSAPFLYRQPTPGSLPGVDAAPHHKKWWFCLLKSDEERAAGTSRRVHLSTHLDDASGRPYTPTTSAVPAPRLA